MSWREPSGSLNSWNATFSFLDVNFLLDYLYSSTQSPTRPQVIWSYLACTYIQHAPEWAPSHISAVCTSQSSGSYGHFLEQVWYSAMTSWYVQSSFEIFLTRNDPIMIWSCVTADIHHIWHHCLKTEAQDGCGSILDSLRNNSIDIGYVSRVLPAGTNFQRWPSGSIFFLRLCSRVQEAR